MWTLYEVVTRLLVGGFLIASGVGKLSSVWTWRQVWLVTYQVLPRVLVHPVAFALPFVELLAGVLLVLGAFGRAGAVLASLQIAAAAAAIGVAVARGVTVSGGCLRRLEPLFSRRVIARNVVFGCAVAVVAWHGPTAPAIAGWDISAQVGLVAMVLAVLITHIALSRRVERQRLLAEFAAG